MTPFETCQQESIDFLADHYHAACEDAPGLGKTKTAILAANKVNAKKVLVICPAGVRTNWHQHISQYAADPVNWTVLSYNFICNQDMRAILGTQDVCIIDEVHFCKETESQRTRAVFGATGVARNAKYKWCLSGTLTPNGRPVEMWPMLKSLHPKFAMLSFLKFAQLYCGMYFDGRENNVKGASRIEEFKSLLNEFVIKHTKAQAFPERSAPIINRIPIDLNFTQLEDITTVEDEILSRVAKISPTQEHYNQLGDSATLRQLLGKIMVPYIIDFMREKLEGNKKLVVFYQHTEVGMKIWQAFSDKNAIIIKGGMSDTQKDEQKRLFLNTESCRVAVLQQQATGTGVDGFQKVCSTAIFAEPDWTPGETEQRLSRLDRMGSQDEIVTAYILFARGTMSEAVLNVHDRKEKVREKLK